MSHVDLIGGMVRVESMFPEPVNLDLSCLFWLILLLLTDSGTGNSTGQSGRLVLLLTANFVLLPKFNISRINATKIPYFFCHYKFQGRLNQPVV